MSRFRILIATPLLALACVGPVLAAADDASAADPAARRTPEPQVLEQVTEDDNVRIEELRVRGQTRRLTVKPKIKGLDGYEIATPEPGRPPADDPKAGQRVWWSIKF
ncbi:MAG: hypothetical protein ACOZJX_04965 [Pseudomonadota bacterium]